MIDTPIAFIVGSPRSGTTIFGEVLDRHEDVAYWYEPYFIWDWHFGNAADDTRRVEEATDEVCSFIRREFECFRRKSRARIVIDKSPEHCFKLLFTHRIFPEAKYIHIVRDGRDVCQSIHREWNKRARIVTERDFRDFIAVAHWTLFKGQPFWRNRLQAVWFELRNLGSLDPKKALNKSKWGGLPGWGPRFEHWRDAFNDHTVLQFNGMQWVESVRMVHEALPRLPPDRYMEVRYEDLVSEPDSVLRATFDFLGLEYRPDWALGETLSVASVGRWQHEFSATQRAELGPIISDKLIKLGYAQDNRWFIESTAP